MSLARSKPQGSRHLSKKKTTAWWGYNYTHEYVAKAVAPGTLPVGATKVTYHSDPKEDDSQGKVPGASPAAPCWLYRFAPDLAFLWYK